MDKSQLLLELLREKQQLKEMGEELLFDRVMTNLVNAITKGDCGLIQESIEEICQIILFRIYPIKLSDSHKYSNLCKCFSSIEAWLGKQYTEWCSKCETDVIVDWSKGMSSECSNCGNKIVFCNKCPHQGENCNDCQY